mgnify:CR=1 FL=1
MTVNTKISTLVSSQLPAFVRDDNPLFTAFLEAYYEYLEQTVSDTGSTGTGKVIERLKNLKNNFDIEKSMEDFSNILYNQFMQFIPQNEGSQVDFKKLLPRIKDFYRARGTEKSYKFLLRLLTNGGESEILYPKDHIFKASDGKWIVQKSLRVTATRLNGNSDNTLSTFDLYTGRQLQGLSSNTTAAVERVEQFYELGTLVNEIYLSSISNTFTSGEVVRTQYYDASNTLVTLTSNIFSGLVSSILIAQGGSGYSIGNPLTFTGGGGNGAVAAISSVSTGNIAGMTVTRPGSGYQVGNFLLFSGGGGTGANGDVLSVNTSGSFHPNTYNIDANQISQIQSATWGAAQTIFSRTTANLALNVISSLASTFTYANCGPVTGVEVLAAGDGYTSVPSISVISNTTIASLGILGSLIINTGGAGYVAGDELVFSNPPDGYGFGAKANVFAVNGTGGITEVRYYSTADNEIKGGLGYFDGYLPSITVSSTGGVGANITAASQIASGASITPTTGTIGSITGISITAGGQGYATAPDISLPGYGDGTANLTATVVQGIFTYPGYFLNQDGFPSSYNYIQDRDYWQNFSYVVRASLAYEKWIQAVKDLLHPSGLRVWGDYSVVDDVITNTSNVASGNDGVSIANTQYFQANAIYFDGDSYFRTSTGPGWYFGAETGAMMFSGWFKLSENLPHTNSEMVLMEASTSAGGIPRFQLAVKKDPYIVGRNLVRLSDQLNNSPTWITTNGSWTVNAFTVAVESNVATSNTIVPMHKFTESGVNGQHYIRQYLALSDYAPHGSNVTFSLYVKAAERYRFYLRMLDYLTGGDGQYMPFDTANGTITTGGGGNAGAGGSLTSGIVPISNGVYRCSVSGYQRATNTNIIICDIILLQNTVGLSDLYPGDGTSGIYFGGVQVERASPFTVTGNNANASIYTKTDSVLLPPQITTGNDYFNPSGTGQYFHLYFANTTGHRVMAIQSDPVRTPIVANVWYHIIHNSNIAQTVVTGSRTQHLWINNVNSSILLSKTSNANATISFAEMNYTSVGANTSGSRAFKGYMSEVWTHWFSGEYPPSVRTVRDDWITPQLTPNSAIPGPTSNGFGWAFNAIPSVYFRGNTALGNTNSGSGAKDWTVMRGNTVGLLPGPGHPSNYD